MARFSRFRRSALRVLRGALILAVVTAVCYHSQIHDISTALLLLIAVVLQSLDCTFTEAAAVSLLATASLDYFFTDPTWSFVVSGPLEAITLTCMLTVTLVITRLQSRSRAEARESNHQRANMESLYKVSQDLLALNLPMTSALPLLEPILLAFDLAGVCLYDAALLESFATPGCRPELEIKTRECFIQGQNASYPELRLDVHVLRAADRIYGAIGFDGLRDAVVTGPAIAALTVAALERARALRSVTTAAVHAEAESTRSALLDALAHEFKTPLATILAAAGGIRVGRSSAEEQGELAEMIETEASRLGDLTTRLLRLARLDREDLKPRLRATDPAELIQRSTQRFEQLWPGHRISFGGSDDVGDVRVDPELIGLALGQLIENACRYAPSDTDVRVELGASDGLAAITVWNVGTIPVAEKDRIFERFYRGNEARMAVPGTGLGLYIARKIARAHGGDVLLINEGQGEIGFRVTLPLENTEVSGDKRDL